MKMFNFNLVLLALLAVSASAQATVVGRVLIAAGDAYAIRNGQELRMATGSPVEEKDTLKTGPASNMQVRFNDESIVSLRDQSLLKIEDYKFSGKQDGFEKAFFNLLKGGFRTVTGLIGKVNKTNYAVKTPTATIGIRGTNYALLICSAGSCGPNAKDGVYGGVSGGIISHTNSKGEYQFGSADYFYSSGLDAEPQKLIGPPSFLGDQLTGQKRGGKPGGSEQAQNGGAESDGRPNKIAQPTPQQDFIVTENRLSSGAPALLSSSTSGFSTGVSIGKAAAFAYTGLILGVIPICELGSGINSNVAVDASGRLIAYDLSPSPARSISIGRFDAFSTPDPAAGNLTVARWAGATAVDSSGALQGPVFIHTVAADFATSVPTSGSVVFSTLIAATNPTNSLGMTGSFG
ncbi:MAG: FecR family protein, partial [Burkholderiales bacterium]